jgi:hypothetical protein
MLPPSECPIQRGLLITAEGANDESRLVTECFKVERFLPTAGATHAAPIISYDTVFL